MKSTYATNPVIDLLQHRRASQKNRVRCSTSLSPPRNGSVTDIPPNDLRIELQVELDNLARSLLEIRRWLSDRGCGHQVFHCVRAGSKAMIRLEFDTHSPRLADEFYQSFLAHSEAR